MQVICTSDLNQYISSIGFTCVFCLSTGLFSFFFPRNFICCLKIQCSEMFRFNTYCCCLRIWYFKVSLPQNLLFWARGRTRPCGPRVWGMLQLLLLTNPQRSVVLANKVRCLGFQYMNEICWHFHSHSSSSKQC